LNALKKGIPFPVPKELRQLKAKIYEIEIDYCSFVIEIADQGNKIHKIKSFITGYKENDIDYLRKMVESKLAGYYDEATTTNCTEKIVHYIDELYDTKAAYVIAKIKKHRKIEDARLDVEGREQKEKPIYLVKKYSGLEVNGLIEAVIIDGEPLFVQIINGGNDIALHKEIETADMILRPPTKQEYPPDSAIEFKSEDELRDCIADAIENETLYTLYRDTRKYYTKEYFVDTESHNTTLLTLYSITSYFQDKFSTVPYIWLIGDNGSGKNSILITYAWLGYRVFYVSGASGANICEYLGTVEEGQGTIAEDELGDLDNDPYKKLLYMTGYASGNCVPKILDGNTKGRDQRYYRSYCQKISASENLPSVKYSKGVLDREFIIKCVKGFPRYNVKMTKKRTRTPEVLRLVNELQTLKKRLFVYRLAHFDDVIEEIQGLSISGRALELTESALLLFNKYKSSPEDDKTFNDEIIPSLSWFLSDRSSRRNDSLEGRLYSIIKTMTEAQSNDEFDNDTIFNTVQAEMEGREISGKPGVFYVDDLGIKISRTKIMKVLREKFKAVPIKLVLVDGSRKNGHKVSKEALERIKASYEDPWEIKILSTEDTSARLNQMNQVIDQYGGQKEETTQEEEPENHDEDELLGMLNNLENEQEDPLESGENTPHTTTEPSLVGLPLQSYSIEEIIYKAMLEPQGTTNRGYFTHLDLTFWLMMLPNEHWTEDSTKELIDKWLQDGKLVEIQPGKYKPTTAIGERGGV
jgi:hypothetical protein